MNLPSIPQARRANREFPRANQCPLPCDGKEDAGLPHVAVIEEILRPRLERVCIDRPALHRNRDTKLTLFVALAAQWNEPQPLIFIENEIDQLGSGNREQRWRLIVISVERPEYPV